jgi:hypothetical protein
MAAVALKSKPKLQIRLLFQNVGAFRPSVSLPAGVTEDPQMAKVPARSILL